uniref:Uncharacterized protein n=1 Tax=Panagrolaimus superbus TaxID=310955 RepID=A0A914Y3K3_9BILA
MNNPSRDNRRYEVQKVKGSYEIIKIIATVHHPEYCGSFEEKVFFKDNILRLPTHLLSFHFHVVTEIELEEVIVYQLQVNCNSYKLLKPRQFFVQNIIFPVRGTSFKCYIKKFELYEPAEIHIVNPDGVTINDQNGDYHCTIEPKEKDMNVTLT